MVTIARSDQVSAPCRNNEKNPVRWESREKCPAELTPILNAIQAGKIGRKKRRMQEKRWGRAGSKGVSDWTADDSSYWLNG